MSYYNYHAMAKKLLNNNNCIGATIFYKYHHISPALVLYFENNKPIPIRQYMWKDYLETLHILNIQVLNPENLEIYTF